MQEQPEHSSERDKRVEFSVPTWLVLNGLEAMGYKVELQKNFRKDFKITDKVANLHKQISHPLGGPMAMYCHPNFISIYRGLMPIVVSKVRRQPKTGQTNCDKYHILVSLM